MKIVLQLLSRLVSWLRADDVERSHAPRAAASVRRHEPNIRPSAGEFISREATRFEITPDPQGTQEETVIIGDGTETIKRISLVPTSCGRFIERPFGQCSKCKGYECGAEHLYLCFRCGCSLCPRCVRYLSKGPAFGHVPVCDEHFRIGRLTGSIDGDW